MFRTGDVMTTYSSENAECFIYTFKEGLLSKVAHDLKLKVNGFEIRWENGEIQADFDPSSIEVLYACLLYTSDAADEA